jgi:hypothetical protein
VKLRNPSYRCIPLIIAALSAISTGARGQIFVIKGNGTVGEYSLSGAAVNPSLITGIEGPGGIAASGNDLFITNAFSGAANGLTQDTVSEYTTSGQLLNPSFIAGLNEPISIIAVGQNLYVGNVNAGDGTIGEYNTSGGVVNASLFTTGGTYYGEPYGLAVCGGDIFVTKPYYSNTIGEYDATSGATVNADLVSGLDYPFGIAAYGGNLFVGGFYDGTIGEYNATTGAVVNPSLIRTGAYGPYAITEYGGDLFVTNSTAGTVSEYDATTGAVINASLVTGLYQPDGIVVVPEPTAVSLLLVIGAGIMAERHREDRIPSED